MTYQLITESLKESERVKCGYGVVSKTTIKQVIEWVTCGIIIMILSELLVRLILRNINLLTMLQACLRIIH